MVPPFEGVFLLAAPGFDLRRCSAPAQAHWHRFSAASGMRCSTYYKTTYDLVLDNGE
jgi:hypothetical protein